jgi:ABC-type branched-subunit amino acid transport system substrate-binding protein
MNSYTGRRTRFRVRVVQSAAVIALVSLGAISAGGAGAVTSSNTSGVISPVTNYVKYVGGSAKAANKKLSPIYIGWINQQGGSADVGPESTIGADVAVDELNAATDGIDGHPVKLVPCFIPDTVSGATSCGEEMANDPSVSAVGIGAVAIGNEAMESAISPTKKVLVFDIALSNVDDEYSPGFSLFGDGTHVEAPFATFAKKYLHTKSASIVYEDLPGEAVGADIIAASLKYEHIPTTIVSYDPTNTDLTAPIEAADVAKSGLFIADVSGTACSDIYLALKQLAITTPVLVNAPCATPQVATGDGGDLPTGWYYAAAASFSLDPTDPDGPAFAKVAKRFGESAYAADPWVDNSYAQILTIARWESQVLKSGKKITPAAVTAVARTFKGPLPFGAYTLVCGSFKSAPAVCNDTDAFFRDVSNVFHPIARLGPPSGFVTPAD